MDKIAELREEKSKLSNRISKIDQEIYQLQQICTHSELVAREPMVLARWNFGWAYSFDSTGTRVIEKRPVSCAACGESWTEMRYVDEVWMKLAEWEKQAQISE